MIAQELEVSLHMAFVQARQQRHESITVEHLLLYLLDNPSARKVLDGCGANAKALRDTLTRHIVQHTSVVPADREVDTQPTLGFQRVIQRAILHVQSSGQKEVTGANVLMAIFGEEKSHALQCLQQQGITRLDVANYLSHGVTKAPAPSTPATDVEDQSDAIEAYPASTDQAPLGGNAIARDLQANVQAAFAEAGRERHEFITVEHLLLALLDNAGAAEVLRGRGANIDELRSDLTQHIVQQTPRVPADRKIDTQPTLGFQRVIQRAILHMQSTGNKEVTGANLLVAIFGEKDSHAVYFLQKQGIARLDVVTYLAHGVTGTPAGDVEARTSDVQVVIYNDDYTPMEFLGRVLHRYFGMNREDAAETMLEIYREGKAVCGLYSRKDGEALVEQIVAFAAENGHPLHCATVDPS